MQEVTQSRDTYDTAPRAEAPSLNTLHVVNVSGAASDVSDLVTTCEKARRKAESSEGGGGLCSEPCPRGSGQEMLVWVIQHTLEGL